MDNTTQIREYIAAIDHMKKFFLKLLEEEKATLSGPASEREKIAELTDLRMLAKSDLWPTAVPASLISDQSSQNARAMGILQTINLPLSGKKFLDFGCGEGHTIQMAKEVFGAKAFGYDQKGQYDLEIVRQNAPYDVIMLFDVLDHADDPENVLRTCRDLKATDGKIFVRFHPWFSRHGTHIYKQLNKAYLQLVFNEHELATLGVIQEDVQKIKNADTYKEWIDAAGLTILSETPTKQNLELFFTHNPAILRRIKSNFDNEFPRNMLEIQFIDMILT